MKSIFVTILCFIIVNVAIASDAVIWQQELSCDSNSECSPGSMVVDSKNNEVIILGTCARLHVREVDFWLWKIDPNGTFKDKKSLGPASNYELLTVGPLGMKAVVKPNTGEIVRLKLDDVNSISLSVTDRNMQSRTAKLGIRWKRSETFLLHDMTSYQNDDLFFVGQENLNGIVMKTDLTGNVVWKKTFNHSQTNILSSVARAPDGENFYVAGISVLLSDKTKLPDPPTVSVCALRYGSSGELKESNFFQGGIAPLVGILPKVICLPSGIVLVVYDNTRIGTALGLCVKAYTPELEPLYEKQILKTKEKTPLTRFDICATEQNHFVLAANVNIGDLRVYECDADSTILQTVELDRAVGGGGHVYVDYLPGKIFVAFATGLRGNEKESKIKLLALRPYKTN